MRDVVAVATAVDWVIPDACIVYEGGICVMCAWLLRQQLPVLLWGLLKVRQSLRVVGSVWVLSRAIPTASVNLA